MSATTNDALRILIEERDRLTRAIEILRQGDSDEAPPAPRRRGRPPAAASSSAPAAPFAAARKKAGRSRMSAEARRAVSERMKKYWADRRKQRK